MMTASSIPASSAAGYASYLEGQTVAPDQGDYYLGPDGSPAEAPGRWLTGEDALRRLGIVEAGAVAGDDLRALMAGRAPGSQAEEERWIRQAGPDGTRAGGIDVTFSAPKSVSIVWALGDADERATVAAAHRDAVQGAVGYLRESVEVTVEWDPDARQSRPVRARELHAAEFMHTTSRGVAGGPPDPQLHSHVVITSVERADGTIAAVRSRPVLRCAREVGAYYRAQLADSLGERGYGIEGAGKDGRYFRVSGVPEPVERAFSKRTEEVLREVDRFRAHHGREPHRGELRAVAVRSRDVKTPRTRTELDRAWRVTAAQHSFASTNISTINGGPPREPHERAWGARVEREITRIRAMVFESELRTVALEQAPGKGLSVHGALQGAEELKRSGRVLELEDGRLTTAHMRDLERDLESRVRAMGAQATRVVDPSTRDEAIAATEEWLGSPLTLEQREAITRLTEGGRAGVLIGPAGTGKSAVIEACAQCDLHRGRRVIGVAVAGRTAQQLGESSPALNGRVDTVNAIIAAAERGHLPVDSTTTVYLDEAGMGDTERLARLVRLVDERGACLLAVGDGRQLPSVGAGGMFERLAGTAPTAELGEVKRTADPAERRSWRALREGDPALAMAHYRERGALRFEDSRGQALERAARRYDQLARVHGLDRVALMTDATNLEVDALNLRVQALRAQRGELGSPEVEQSSSGHHFHAGDRVAWRASMNVAGERRVENGVRGEVAAINAAGGSLTVRLDGSGREVPVPEDAVESLRLGYAGHVYRQQGATVDRAVTVTGGWQTSREAAYVEASRARMGTEWYVARDELGGETDAERIDQLAARMRVSRAQAPSISLDLASFDGDELAPATISVGVGVGHPSMEAPAIGHPGMELDP